MNMGVMHQARPVSSLALNMLVDGADTTEAGKEFQSLTSLMLKEFLLVRDLALVFSIFHSCPLVLSDVILFKEVSNVNPMLPFCSWYAAVMSPLLRR